MHEFDKSWEAGNPRFAQFLDALHDQPVIGMRGAETESGAGDRVFDLGGQFGQDAKHFALIVHRAGLTIAVHQFRQLLFALVQPFADFLGNGQAEQGHHPVSLDFNQTLYRAAGLALSQFFVEDQKP